MTGPSTERASDAAPAFASAAASVRLGDLLGLGCLVLLPLAMWLANRSAPLMLGLSTLGFLVAALAESGPSQLIGRLRAVLASPIALVLSAFLLWALASLGWSHRSLAAGLSAWAELAFPLLCGALLAASGRFRPDLGWNRALALAIILASLLMTVELLSGLSQRAALGIGRPYGFVFNRPVLTCLLLSAAILPLLLDRLALPGSWLRRGLGLLLLAALLDLVLVSDSGAATFGLLIMALVWSLAALAPRFMLGAVALAFVVTMALAPFTGVLVDKALPPDMHQRFAQSHSRERADIWLSFGEAIRARPMLGSGFASSATLDQNPVAQAVSAEHRRMLAAGHPHSAPMQAWVETGFVGAALSTLAGLLLLWRLRALPARQIAPRLALFSAAFAIAATAHGAWQGWWAAGLVVAALWLHAQTAAPAQAPPGLSRAGQSND